MIRARIDDQDKASVSIDGNLGTIYPEIALICKIISDQEELGLTFGDVLDRVQESYLDLDKIELKLSREDGLAGHKVAARAKVSS